MFKRLEKKLKRKEEEEELGIDEDMKDIMGLNDTDTDESASDSDSELSVEGEFQGIKGFDEEVMEEDEEDEGTDRDEEEDGQHEERDLITVAEALKDPVYLVSLDPEIKECVVCPGKQLRGAKMVEIHKFSNAHKRRFKQLQKLAAGADRKANAYELLTETRDKEFVSLLPAPSESSKRAEKRRIAKEKHKAKRERAKIRAKAKKDALEAQVIPSSLEANKPIQIDEKNKASKKPEKKMIEFQTEKVAGKGGKEREIKDDTKSTNTKRKRTKHSEYLEASAQRSKKRKTDAASPSERTTELAPPSETKATKKSNTQSTPSESPELVRELQSQVNEIIKSASDLAKSARLRALGDDTMFDQ